MIDSRIRFVRAAFLSGIGATALLIAGAAGAQVTTSDQSANNADATASQDDGNLIVVTARGSKERLQDVPIVVTALSAEDLVRQNIDDLSDVAEKTVGFAFETFTGPLAQPVIRGQTNLRTTSPVQNVATNLNGIYIQRGYFVDQGLLDLERIEIIKGPQSALYGRNAFAGVISLVTRQPDLDNLSGRATATIGTDDRYEVKGGVNVPIIPGVFAVYGAAAYSEFDGTWKNNHPLAGADGAFTKGKLGGYEKRAYQVGAKLKIADMVTLEGQYIRTERELESNPSYTLSTSGLTTPFNTLNASPVGVGAARQNRLYVGKIGTTPINAPGEGRLPGLVVDPRSYGLRGPSEIWIGKATLDNGGPFTLQYIFGHTEANIVARGSAQRDPLLPTVAFGVNFGNVFDSSGTGSEFTSDSHEGRATFDFGGTVTGFVGINFTRTSDIESNASEFAPVNSLVEPTADSLYPVFPGAPIPTTVTFRRNTYLQRKENVVSGFAFVQWKPTDTLAITLEGRYTEENQKAADLIASEPAPNTNRIAQATPRNKRDASFFTPRGSITYRFAEDHNVYGAVGRGYKSGGINGVSATFNRVVNPTTGAVSFVQLTPGGPLFPAQQFYAAETNYTYEIGSKNRFMDGALTLNLAAYYTDWKNVQSNAVRLQPDGTPPVSFLAIVPSLIGNVGDVKVYGAEIEGNYRITRELRFDFGASYNRARYKSGVVSQRIGASGNCDGIVCASVAAPGFTYPVLPIGGNQLERTPEFDALAGLNFDTEFGNGWGFFARGDVTYQTKQFADEANLAFVPSRTLVNASAGVSIGKLNLQIWAKNLFDRKYVTSALFLVGTGGAGSASYVPILGEQRTAGVTASYSF